MPPPQPPTPRIAAVAERDCSSVSGFSSSSALIPFKPGQTSLRKQKILTEDEYTDSLSSIIKRDFFPNLDRLKAENDYLSALEDGDDIKVRHALHKLVRIEERDGRIAQTPRNGSKRYLSATPVDPSRSGADPKETPLYGNAGTRSWEDTPARPSRGNETAYSRYPHTAATATTVLPEGEEEEEQESSGILPNTGLSLDAFQSRYTSEDNAAFSQILDRVNLQKKEKYAWAYEAERKANQKRKRVIEAAQQEATKGKRLAITAAEESGKRIEGKERLLIELSHPKQASTTESAEAEGPMDDLVLVPESRKDDRKASVGSWRFTARNNFMYPPDANINAAPLRNTSLPRRHMDEAGSSMFNDTADLGPSVNYRSTNFAEYDGDDASVAPDIPSGSRIDAAIRGSIVASSVTSGSDAGALASPKVAGYGFVTPHSTPQPERTSKRRGFNLPPTPRWEEIASKMATPNGNARHTGPKMTPKKGGTPSASARLKGAVSSSLGASLLGKKGIGTGTHLQRPKRDPEETHDMERLGKQRWTPTPSPVRRGA